MAALDRPAANRAAGRRWHRRLLGAALALAWGWMTLSGAAAAQENQVAPQAIIIKPTPGFSATISTDKGQYRQGDLMTITFSVSQQAYVYIYNLDTQGRVRLIFPNRYDRSNRLGPGTYRIPDRGYVLRMSGPDGVEYLQLIASKTPVSIYSAGALDAEAFPSLSSNGVAFKGQVSAKLSGVGDSDWVAAWTSYRIGSLPPWPSPAPVPLPPSLGTLRVTSEPSGARVYVDDLYAGRTPVETDLRPGRYDLRVEADGYRDFEDRVRIEAGSRTVIGVTLQRETPPPPRYPVIGPEQARYRAGETVTVDYVVSRVYEDGGITYLESGADFVAVVYERDRARFGDLYRYQGARLRVTGRIEVYNAAEMRLQDPSQVEVVRPAGPASPTLPEAEEEEPLLDRRDRERDRSAQPSGPVGLSVGFTAGVGPDPEGQETGNVMSFGLEFGGSRFGVGLASRFTGDPGVPAYYPTTDPNQVERPSEPMEDGPETELFGKLVVARFGSIALEAGAGFAWQRWVQVTQEEPAAAGTSVTSDGTVRAMGTSEEPVGYVTTHFYPTVMAGARYEAERFYFSAGYHLRRGLVMGLGLRF